MTGASKEEAVRRAHDMALAYTPQCRSCSRGTALALMDVFDIRDDGVFKAACGLHGGIGGQGDVCGSLLGASLVVGLVCGSSLSNLDREPGPAPVGDVEPDEATRLVGELYSRFRRQFRTVRCRLVRGRFEREMNGDITARDLPEPEKMARLFAKCDDLTAGIAATTAGMLWDAMKRR